MVAIRFFNGMAIPELASVEFIQYRYIGLIRMLDVVETNNNAITGSVWWLYPLSLAHDQDS